MKRWIHAATQLISEDEFKKWDLEKLLQFVEDRWNQDEYALEQDPRFLSGRVINNLTKDLTLEDDVLSLVADYTDTLAHAGNAPLHIAMNPNASAETLTKLYNYAKEVRYTSLLEVIAHNDNTPRYIIEEMTTYPYHSSVRRVAENILKGKKTYRYRPGYEPIDLEEEERRKNKKYIIDNITEVVESILSDYRDYTDKPADEKDIVREAIYYLEGDMFQMYEDKDFTRDDVVKVVRKLTK